jgi:hypothetical protein
MRVSPPRPPCRIKASLDIQHADFGAVDDHLGLDLVVAFRNLVRQRRNNDAQLSRVQIGAEGKTDRLKARLQSDRQAGKLAISALAVTDFNELHLAPLAVETEAAQENLHLDFGKLACSLRSNDRRDGHVATFAHIADRDDMNWSLEPGKIRR